MNTYIEEIKKQFKQDNATIKIAIICAIFWIINQLIHLLFSFDLNANLFLNSNFNLFIEKPWSIFTFFLSQGSFSDVTGESFFNLIFIFIFLYYSEKLFRVHFDESSFWKFFIFGNLFAGVTLVLLGFILPRNFILFGFSSGVYSIFYAIVAYQPKFSVQLLFISKSINLELIGKIFLGINLLLMFSNFKSGFSGIYTANVLGSIFGYLYMKQFEKGNDFLGNIINTFKPKKKKFTYERRKTPPRDDYEYNEKRKEKNDELDKILDKISASGYESLTKKEKEFLFNQRK